MHALQSNINTLLGDLPNRETIMEEASFGFRHIQPYLKALKKGAHVLEVGSGPGVLLALTSDNRRDVNVTGIEPIGPGFDLFKPSLERLQKETGFDIFLGGYEDYDADQKFDLIYAVNVFEHLPDWRHFLGFVKKHLNDDGVCVLLCPNYNFPYESHFWLPIIGNKKITYKIFHKKIHAFEEQYNVKGLWESLNFVKWSQVKSWAKSDQNKKAEPVLDVSFCPDVLSQMVERMDNDPAFAWRQRKLAFLVKIFKALKGHKLLHMPFLFRFHPYMKLEIRKKQ